MNWPLVTIERYRKAEARAKAALERGQEMAINYANASEEISRLKMSISNLMAANRSFETQLADSKHPPISSEELKQLLHRVAFLQAENEGMRRKFIPDGIWPLPDVQ